MTPLDELRIREDEANLLAELLRECDEPRAADLIAARLGGYRDALAVLAIAVKENATGPGGDHAGPEQGSQRDAAAAAPAPKAGTPAPPQHAHRREENGGRQGVWTPERLALLRRLWAEGERPHQILDALNKLPGPFPVASSGAVSKKATLLELPRREGLRGRMPADPLADIPADDLEEARQMLAAGNIGARGLHEYFGWEIKRAQGIADALRAEQRSAAA